MVRPDRGHGETTETLKEFAMPELPSHEDTGPAVSEAPIVGMSRRRKVLIVAAAVTLLVLIAVLHLTGVVGGESH